MTDWPPFHTWQAAHLPANPAREARNHRHAAAALADQFRAFTERLAEAVAAISRMIADTFAVFVDEFRPVLDAFTHEEAPR